MQDYIATGRALQNDWLRHHETMTQSLLEVLDKPPPYSSPKYDFLRAVLQYRQGAPTMLAEYLRSKRPISTLDREYLAQVIEAAPAKKGRRGRPKSRGARSATMMARTFYAEWRRKNKAASTPDHGKSGEMKDISVRFVLEELGGFSASFTSVRKLMDRPKSRRT